MAAWTIYYQRTEPVLKGGEDVLGYAIRAIKNELVYNGAAVDELNTRSFTFGDATRRSVRRFQRIQGIDDDGVVGPITARHLWRKRFRAAQDEYGVPTDLACRLKSLESANDPAAIGAVDPADTGLVQINLRIHSNVQLAQAVDPAFCSRWCCQWLSDAAEQYDGDWIAATASWNVGRGGAASWHRAGKPPTGGTSNLPDLYDRATRYVELVSKQSC